MPELITMAEAHLSTDSEPRRAWKQSSPTVPRETFLEVMRQVDSEMKPEEKHA